MKAGMGMSASSTGGRAGFPPFPDSAAGAFAFKRWWRVSSPALVIYGAQRRDAEVLPGKAQGLRQHFLALPRHLRLPG